MKLWINLLHCRNSGNAKWRTPLGLRKDVKISLASEIKPTKNGWELVKMNLCKFKELRKRVQNGVRGSKSEYFRSQFENCVCDSKQTYRFLDLIKAVRKNSEIISTVKDKIGDRIVNKTETATVFNDYFVEIGENLLSRLLEVDEPLMRQIIPDFCIWLYPTNEDEVSKIITNLAKKHSSGADA